ncbi:MAG TPA: two-component system activity regulator YycH [Pseudogracilibacillus sp.]|nr:two-component system activity regulator YycH [Pseudogracilibacillus sp.]
MNYETMKSFVLVVLIGISLLLSFILWSYQPNYDYLQDADYVNEVDVGGEEKSKNELIHPSKVIFNNQVDLKGFKEPGDMLSFYQEMTSWVLYDYDTSEAKWNPGDSRYVEIIFPSKIPAELVTSLFTFNDDIEVGNWSFDRIYLSLDGDEQLVDVIIKSDDNRRQIKAKTDKSQTYEQLLSYLVQDHKELEEYITLQTEDNDIYIPKEEKSLPEKTVIAKKIKPEQFINALFPNPSLVTPNVREAYFTDGQRGMQVENDDLSLEYINPIGSNYDRIPAAELIDRSVNHINEQHGWTNNFNLTSMNKVTNKIRYRMTYEGYPLSDNHHLSVIEQEWRDQELYNYVRPLVEVGNVLNNEDSELISGEKLIKLIEQNKGNLKLDNMKDIRVGYYLSVTDDRSLTLKPEWFIVYENEWVRFDADDYRDNPEKGEDG